MAGGVRVTFVAFAITLAGCSLVTSLRGFDEGDKSTPVDVGDGAASSDRDIEGPSPDASPIEEASADAGAGDTEAGDALATDAGGEILPNGGFENGSCGPPLVFNPNKTSAASSTSARSGALSCRVCNVGAPMGSYGLYTDFPTGQLGPGKYTLDAYVREDGVGGSSVGSVQLTVRSSGGGSPRYPSMSTDVSVFGWAHLHVVADVAAGEYLASASVGGYSDTIGPCLLVDDVTIVRE